MGDSRKLGRSLRFGGLLTRGLITGGLMLVVGLVPLAASAAPLGPGACTITGTPGDDVLTGSNDPLVIDVICGLGGDDELYGLSGNDELYGGAGDDELLGGRGNDLLDGGYLTPEEVAALLTDIDALYGQRGLDTASYADAPEGVSVDLGAGTASSPSTGTDTISTTENIVGSQFDDSLKGNAGDNAIDGNLGDDTLSYADAPEGVSVDLGAGTASSPSTGTDTITLMDNIVGSEFDDSLEGDEGDNTIDGNLGDDTLSYADAPEGVSVDLYLGTASSPSTGTDAIILMENIVGSQFDDSLIGDPEVNDVSGLGGSDYLFGYQGNDELYGGTGDDELWGGRGDDLLDGGYLTLEELGAGLTDDDSLNGMRWNDTVSYADAPEGVTVDLGASTATGPSTGTDTISTTENIVGSNSADVLTGDGGDNTIDGNVGDDTLSYADAAEGVEVSLQGGTATGPASGTDTITAMEHIAGSAFDDVLQGDAGDNTIDGNDGVDTISYADAPEGVVVELYIYNGTATGPASGTDTISTTENIIGSALDDDLTGDFGSNRISGLDGSDVLWGSRGSDELHGGTGNDELQGGRGEDLLDGGYLGPDDGGLTDNDSLMGGGAFDTVSYADALEGVSVDLGAGTASSPSIGTDTISTTENIAGSAFDDALQGDAGDNTIEGNDGDDAVSGNDGVDTISYEDAPEGVSVDLYSGTATGPATGTDTIDTTENIIGSPFADVLYGDSKVNDVSGLGGSDYLHGYPGSDELYGGTGDDALYGGRGDDLLDGGYLTPEELGAGLTDDDSLNGMAWYDTVSYADAPEGVTVDLDASTATGPATGTDTIIGTENIAGSSFADVLTGNAWDNTIEGNDGDDTIEGNDGDDTISHANLPYGGFGVNVDLDLGTATGYFIGTDTLGSMENIEGTPFADVLYGDEGMNTIQSFQGVDTIDGRGEVDTLSFADSPEPVQVSFLSLGTATGWSYSQTETISSMENFEGSAFDDFVLPSGDEGSNAINGNDGVDTLYYADALAGVSVDLDLGTATGTLIGTDTISTMENIEGTPFDDVLKGDYGNNTIQSYAGVDTVDGHGGDDTLSFAQATEGVSVDLNLGTAFSHGQTDTISSMENIDGSWHDDVLNGDDGKNTIRPGLGADTIDGRGEDDTLSYANHHYGVYADLILGTAVSFGQTSSFSDMEHIVGSWGDDILQGDAGNNNLSGLGGSDSLDGGAGDDDLSGGTGDDTLSAVDGVSGNDTIDGGDDVDGCTADDGDVKLNCES